MNINNHVMYRGTNEPLAEENRAGRANHIAILDGDFCQSDVHLDAVSALEATTPSLPEREDSYVLGYN